MQPKKEKLKNEIVALVEKEGIGEVSGQVGISTQGLRDIRSGRSSVTLDTLLAFAEAYPEQFGPIIEEVFGFKGAQKETNVDYKTLYEDERNERIRITKVNERLAISMLEKAGLLTDQPEVKLPSSSHVTAEYRRIGYEQLTIPGAEKTAKQPRRMIVPDIAKGVPFRGSWS